MAVEMNDRHGAVGPVDGPEQGQRDGMVTTEGDHARQRLALFRWADLVRVGGRLAGEDAVVALLDLVKGPRVVVRGNRDVTTVQHGGPAVERVRVQWDVVASAEAQPGQITYSTCYGGVLFGGGNNALKVQPSRALANTGGTETCAGTVRCTSVERSTWVKLSMSDSEPHDC